MPVLEQLRCLVVGEPERKDPQCPVVGVLKRLRSSLAGTVAKDDPLDSMPLAQEPDHLLLRQLAQAVGAGRARDRLVGAHGRDRAAANRAGWIPDPPLERV